VNSLAILHIRESSHTTQVQVFSSGKGAQRCPVGKGSLT
jgi:hypothetical protein